MWWTKKESNSNSNSNNETNSQPSSSSGRRFYSVGRKGGTPGRGAPKKAKSSHATMHRRFSKGSRASSTRMLNSEREQLEQTHPERSYPESENEERDTTMLMADTGYGIEVSFSADSNSTHPDDVNQKRTGAREEKRVLNRVISLKDQLAEREKIHRSQFNISNWTSIDAGRALPTMANRPQTEFRTRNHRVPLFGSDNKRPQMMVDDMLFLLRNHQVVDEITCVRDELALMSAEIEALQADKADLARTSLYIAHSNDNPGQDWDIYQMLAGKAITPSQRAYLQDSRGRSLTVSLNNARAQDTFLSKCGCKASEVRKTSHPGHAGATAITLTPQNCRQGGAAATIQHIALLQGQSESSFFISKDHGKSYYWGSLPDRLFRRMKENGRDPHLYTSDILYLSTGPQGCYYVQFRSGECWWGASVEDNDFHQICSDWNVHRVSFGPFNIFEGEQGQRRVSTSWLVIGRDGRAAWKNIPARLHNILSSRMANEPAPVEVSLGYGGSYFIRFVDGSTDYCLPNRAATLVKDMAITSVYLHPEMPNDFVIRHH